MVVIRHPFQCSEQRCQICQFSSKLEKDNINPTVNSVKVDDILDGSIRMPFNQKSAWLKVQNDDRVNRMLPEPKKTRRLHNSKMFPQPFQIWKPEDIQ